MVVAGSGYRAAQEVLIFVHTGDEGREKHQKLSVLPGGLAGAEEIPAGIRGQRPVVVLTGAVDSGEGLFVEQTHQIVLGGALFHNRHHLLVVVTGGVGVGVNGSQLVLTGRALVVLGLAQDAQPPQLLV